MKSIIVWGKQRIAGMRFTTKCILLLFLGVLIPLTAQSVVFRLHTEESVNRELMEKLNQELQDDADKFAAVLSELTTIAGEYRQNEMLYHYLDQEYSKDLEVMVRYQDDLYGLFTGKVLFPKEIRSICVYTNNEGLFNSVFVRKEDNVLDGSLGRTLLYSNMQPVTGKPSMMLQSCFVEDRASLYDENRFLSLLVTLDYYQQYGRYDKLMAVDVDLGYVSSVLNAGKLFRNIIMTDSQGVILADAHGYSGGPSYFSPQDEEFAGMQIMEKQIGSFPLTLYGICDPEIFAKEFDEGRFLSIGISGVCLLICCVFILTLARNINRRLGSLVRQAGEIAHGHFVTTKVREGGRDEFDLLQNGINAMSVQLKTLIEEGYQAEIARMELEKETNQAKLLSLQAQVNPHFMFNALESIRLRALAKGERETAGVIKHMARMFRNLIEWDRNVIPLREELKFLDEFLYIQRYRFEDEFSYEIDVAGEAYDCLLPKMILQPLVENACVHGVEAVAEDRWVGIRAQTSGNVLEIRVEDNGGGIPPEKLTELRSMIKGDAQASRSVGVWNVYRRLALSYGDAFTFQINSTPGRGTVCTVRIPMKKEDITCTQL